MADISEELESIETEILGERVRDAVVSAINKIFNTGVTNVDDKPEPDSEHPARSGGIYNSIREKELTVDKVLVTIDTNWVVADPFYHVISVSGITSDSKLDIIPTATLMTVLRNQGVSALWLENDNGTVTAYAVGLKPNVPLSFYCEVNEGVT